MSISFNNNVPDFLIDNEPKVCKWLSAAINNEGFNLNALEFQFLSDEELLVINNQHLKHNNYTDVITFDYADGDNEVDGEILISTERVEENSSTYETTGVEELLRVMIHGVLHLCGYGDKTKREEQEMREKETQYLNLFDF